MLDVFEYPNHMLKIIENILIFTIRLPYLSLGVRIVQKHVYDRVVERKRPLQEYDQ